MLKRFIIMKIVKIIYENVYDFSAMLECEFCQSTQKLYRGFSSEFYKTTIIGNIQCHKCKKQTLQTIFRSC